MSEFLQHYGELISDPAHTAVEFTFVLVDVLIIDAVRRRIYKHFHKDIDNTTDHLHKDMGVSHDRVDSVNCKVIR